MDLDSLWEQAQKAQNAGEFALARDTYALMLHHLLSQDKTFPPILLERLADVCIRLAQFRSAARLLLAVRSRMREIGDEPGVVYATLKLAGLWLHAADIQGAERFLSEAGFSRAMHPDLETEALGIAFRMSWPSLASMNLAVLRIQACLTLARYWTAVGRFEAAKDAIQKAIKLAPEASDFFSAPGMAVFLAELCLDCGDFDGMAKAERLFNQLSQKATNHASDIHVERWCLLQAQRDRMMGQFSSARKTLETWLSHREHQPLREVDIQAAWMLCDILGRLNRVQAAEHWLTRIEKRFSDDIAEQKWSVEFQRLRLLLTKRRAANSRDLTLPFLPQQVGEEWSRDSLDDPPYSPELNGGLSSEPSQRTRERFADEWAVQFNHVLIALDDNHISKAIDSLRALSTSISETDSLRLKARTRYLEGLVAFASGDAAAAYEAMMDSADAARKQGLYLDMADSIGFGACAAKRLGRQDAYVALSAQHKDLLDNLLLALDSDDRIHRRRNILSKQDEYLAQRILQLVPFNPRPKRTPLLGMFTDWFYRREYQRNVLKQCREMTCLVGWDIARKLNMANEKSIQADVPTPDQAITGEQVEVWMDMQRTLRSNNPKNPSRRNLLNSFWPLTRVPRNHAIIHFYVVADRLFIFVLARGLAQIFAHPVSRIMLDEAVSEALRAIEDQYLKNLRDSLVTSALRQLSQSLNLEQICSTLAGHITHLTIIPHDIIVHAPFAALPFNKQSIPLCSRFSINIIPTLDFYQSPPWLSRLRPSAPRSFLAIAVSDSGNEAAGTLSHTIAEALEIQRLLPCPSCILRDKMAQRRSVIDALERTEFAHFACHGIFDTEIPHRSRLLLGGGPEGAQELTLADIHARNLSGLRLAVLAACWTASTAVLPGGEFVSIPAAFLHAGAQGVLAPLWRVVDAGSEAFMARFYQAVQLALPAHALAMVQREMSGRVPPYFWAPYLYYGSM